MDPASLYVNNFNPGITNWRFFAPDQFATPGTLNNSDLNGNNECDNFDTGPAPILGDNTYTATEIIMPFPVPIVGPLQIVAAP